MGVFDKHHLNRQLTILWLLNRFVLPEWKQGTIKTNRVDGDWVSFIEQVGRLVSRTHRTDFLQSVLYRFSYGKQTCHHYCGDCGSKMYSKNNEIIIQTSVWNRAEHISSPCSTIHLFRLIWAWKSFSVFFIRYRTCVTHMHITPWPWHLLNTKKADCLCYDINWDTVWKYIFKITIKKR